MWNRQDKGIALITTLLVLVLMLAMMVGVTWLVMGDQKLGGNNSDRQLAFYGAESGLEALTAGLENTFVDPDAVYDVLRQAQSDASNVEDGPVRKFGSHGLRHLYSSLLIESGTTIKFAQAKMGHASAATTLDIYSHVITNQGRQCAEKVAAACPCVSNLLADASVAELEAEQVI